jgi:Kef-type K+ transport system membrane component KefB
MMADISLTGVLVVAAIAFTVPLLLGLAPTLHLPSVVLEIIAGIVIGPAILGLVEVDLPLEVLALLGLAFLLFLAGLEIDLDRLRGARLRIAAIGFVVSLAVALVIGLVLYAAGIIQAPLLVAIILSSTSLGIVIPVLADAGHSSTRLGGLPALYRLRMALRLPPRRHTDPHRSCRPGLHQGVRSFPPCSGGQGSS